MNWLWIWIKLDSLQWLKFDLGIIKLNNSNAIKCFFHPGPQKLIYDKIQFPYISTHLLELILNFCSNIEIKIAIYILFAALIKSQELKI